MVKRQDASTGEIVDDGAQPVSSSAPVMAVKVASPFNAYFDGPAQSISGENITGPFDILPHHHNFICLLKPCELIIRDGKDEKRIRISGGLMHVKADRVEIFLDV